MSYSHIIRAILGACWAIDETYLRAIVSVVDRRMQGIRLTDDEINEAVAAQDQHAPLLHSGESNAALDGRRVRSVAQQEGDVMVLPVYGVISNRAYMVKNSSGPSGTSAEILSQLFNKALGDPNIKAIVLDVNSPGGTVGGVEELSAEIFNARGKKPIIAQVNSFAASAAYWVGSAADEIVVTPTGEVGSIGVWALHEDWSKNLENEGVKPTLVSAGKFKVEGNPYEPLSEEARAAIQADVSAYYDMFTAAVARNRGVDVAVVKDGFGEGRMVRASEAVKQGMADRIGTMSDTLARLGVTVGGKQQPQQRASHRTAQRAHRLREIEILKLKQ